MARTTTVQIPVLIGENYRHLMGTAEVVELEEKGQAKVTLSITADGAPIDARDLVALFTTGSLLFSSSLSRSSHAARKINRGEHLMSKDASYHEAAVYYNEQLAIRAEQLVDEISERFGEVDPFRWARSVGKQHRFHEGRHKKALDKIRRGEKTVNTEDGGEDRVVDDERVVHKSAVDGQFVSAAEAAEDPDTTYETTVEVPTPAQRVEAGPDMSQAPAPVAVDVSGEEQEEKKEA